MFVFLYCRERVFKWCKNILDKVLLPKEVFLKYFKIFVSKGLFRNWWCGRSFLIAYCGVYGGSTMRGHLGAVNSPLLSWSFNFIILYLIGCQLQACLVSPIGWIWLIFAPIEPLCILFWVYGLYTWSLLIKLLIIKKKKKLIDISLGVGLKGPTFARFPRYKKKV